MLLSSFIEVLAQFAVRTPRVEAGDSELFSSSGGASSRVAARGSGSFRVVVVSLGFLSSCPSGIRAPHELEQIFCVPHGYSAQLGFPL